MLTVFHSLLLSNVKARDFFDLAIKFFTNSVSEIATVLR